MRGDTYIFSFTASPEGEGAWMQSKTYGTVNCLLQRLALRKDCSICPITSTIGVISNNSGISFAHHHDALIVLDASKANISNKCIVTEVQMGAGIVTKKNEKTFQVMDNAAQLEYFYQEKTDTICGMEFHKLTNLDTTYLQISTMNSSIIYNVATGFCLTHNFGIAACNANRPQGFILVNNQIAIPSGDQVECTVYSHVSTEYFNFLKSVYGTSSRGKR
jgi:hypothetical protein